VCQASTLSGLTNPFARIGLSQARPFSKVVSIVALRMKYTRALAFKNFVPQATASLERPAPTITRPKGVWFKVYGVQSLGFRVQASLPCKFAVAQHISNTLATH